MKYLLSTGRYTSKLEVYVLDLFKLYLCVFPKDIPGAPRIGFDFILTDVKKDELVRVIEGRVESLITTIKNRFDKSSLEISLESLEIIDESRVKAIISVNQMESSDITINLKDYIN